MASPLEGFIGRRPGPCRDGRIGAAASIRDAVVRYMRLFNPPGRRARSVKTLRLLTELEQPIRDNRVSRRGTDYVAAPELWREAMEDIVERARQPGSTLTLPLKSHGYLFEVVAGKCEQAAAQAEKRSEQGGIWESFTGRHARLQCPLPQPGLHSRRPNTRKNHAGRRPAAIESDQRKECYEQPDSRRLARPMPKAGCPAGCDQTNRLGARPAGGRARGQGSR